MDWGPRVQEVQPCSGDSDQLGRAVQVCAPLVGAVLFRVMEGVQAGWAPCVGEQSGLCAGGGGPWTNVSFTPGKQNQALRLAMSLGCFLPRYRADTESAGAGSSRQVRRMGSVSEELSLVPLHQRPELLEACAKLLGEEWGKSRASRLHTLQRSSDAFPACLLLLRSQGRAEGPAAREGPCQLVGHVRLSRVAGRPRDLFVESVVVARALRGQGYGRRLMEATERWARARGFHCLHLTTHDKQHFYAHLGYALGEPVQSVAFLSPAIPAEVLRLFSTIPGTATATITRPRVPSTPPPPLPPPAAPPPPPPPTVVWARGVLAESSGESLLETPHRDAKGLPIFWMKKDI
ncbi:N-alpha-acetyltransferase 80 [Chroicocephalus ridibundus]|uniref:N-alpha-acetyltransferase 80 n=1 Tax=Chroicocephalus ridibundus TaxID=1192867 RepID=UPI002FDE7484